MNFVIDTARPEWRDPEYGQRLAQIRQLQAESPHRPMILFVGSSRVQMGILPEAMAFEDKPDSPLPYNLGYRGAQPPAIALQVLRLIDAGHKPAAVVVEYCPAVMLSWGGPHSLPKVWPNRLSVADLTRLRQLGANGDSTPFTSWTRPVWANAAVPWSNYRLTLLNYWLPELVPLEQLKNMDPERIERFGFRGSPHQNPTPEQRTASMKISQQSYKRLFTRTVSNQASHEAMVALVNRCRAEGIPIAFMHAPESATFRSWFSPESIAAGNSIADYLRREMGVPVFPAPDHLEENDFADGYHLMRHGAEKYSRWLADTHIKPWWTSQRLAGTGSR